MTNSIRQVVLATRPGGAFIGNVAPAELLLTDVIERRPPVWQLQEIDPKGELVLEAVQITDENLDDAITPRSG